MRILPLFMAGSLSLLSGCATLDYYAQSIGGHLSLMARRQPIEQLLLDDETDKDLKDRLLLVRSVRDFASQSLGLPDNGSYRSFVPVAGEALVWSLVAAGEFSVQPRQWCYPVIGCASYRGYFDQREARRHGSLLERQGLDVAIEPVPAYSTLGWFDDPVPGTVIRWSDWQIAGLIIHELAHQRLYLPGDSAFNEAFANVVMRIGTARWLVAAKRLPMCRQWRAGKLREKAFIALLLGTRQRLERLYALPLPEQQKRQAKEEVLLSLNGEYRRWRQQWAGYSGYDRWFEVGVNNARLASIATYEQWGPAFELLYRQSDGDMESFYRACQGLAALDPGGRLTRLRQLKAEAAAMGQSIDPVSCSAASQ